MANEQVVLSRAFVSVCPVLLNPSLTSLNVNNCCHLLTCPGRACFKIAFAFFLRLRSTRALLKTSISRPVLFSRFLRTFIYHLYIILQCFLIKNQPIFKKYCIKPLIDLQSSRYLHEFVKSPFCRHYLYQLLGLCRMYQHNHDHNYFQYP